MARRASLDDIETHCNVSLLFERLLEEGLRVRFGRAVPVAGVRRERLETSSHPISRVQVSLGSGEQIDFILKRLRPGLKPSGNEREVLTYRRLLSGARFGSAQLYASLYDPGHCRYWLLLEDVGDWTLEDSEITQWLAAAAMLGEMHSTYNGRDEELRRLDCLEEHDGGYYHRIAWIARHNLLLAGNDPAVCRFDAIMRPFESVVDYLTSLPRTLVHGDIIPQNLIVQAEDLIRPIDWESAGIGLGAWDLARLMDGWGVDQVKFIDTYLASLSGRTIGTAERQEFLRTLDYCAVINVLWHLHWSDEACLDRGWVEKLLDELSNALRLSVAGGACRLLTTDN